MLFQNKIKNIKYFSEIDLMEKIQKMNFTKQMKIISKPFNTGSFIVIIFALFIYDVIDLSDVKLLLYGCIIGTILKFIFRRKRPYFADERIKNYTGKDHIDVFEHYSFPSGHTFAATFFSLMMLHKYPHEFMFNIVGVLVGFSRIFLGVHYPTDIIGGILFAFITFQILI